MYLASDTDEAPRRPRGAGQPLGRRWGQTYTLPLLVVRSSGPDTFLLKEGSTLEPTYGICG